MNLSGAKALIIRKYLAIGLVVLAAIAVVCIFLPFYDISSMMEMSLKYTGQDIDMGPITGISAVFGFNAEMDGAKGVLLEFSFLAFIPYILAFGALGGAAGMLKKSGKYDFIIVGALALVSVIMFMNLDSLLAINEEVIEGFNQGFGSVTGASMDKDAIWDLIYDGQFGKTLCIVVLWIVVVVSICGIVIDFMPKTTPASTAEAVNAENAQAVEEKVE